MSFPISNNPLYIFYISIILFLLIKFLFCCFFLNNSKWLFDIKFSVEHCIIVFFYLMINSLGEIFISWNSFHFTFYFLFTVPSFGVHLGFPLWSIRISSSKSPSLISRVKCCFLNEWHWLDEREELAWLFFFFNFCMVLNSSLLILFFFFFSFTFSWAPFL